MDQNQRIATIILSLNVLLKQGEFSKCVQLIQATLREDSAILSSNHPRLLKITAEMMEKKEKDSSDTVMIFDAEPKQNDESRKSLDNVQLPMTANNGRPLTALNSSSKSRPSTVKQQGASKTSLGNSGSSNSLESFLSQQQHRPSTASIIGLGRELSQTNLTNSNDLKGENDEIVNQMLFRYFYQMDSGKPMRAYELAQRNVQRLSEGNENSADEDECLKDWWNLQLARSQVKLAKIDDACKLLTQLHQRDPSDLEYLLWLIKVSYGKETDKLIQEGLKLHGESKRLLLFLAKRSELNKNWKDCTKYLEKILKLDPFDLTALSVLGATYFHSDQPECAKGAYERLLDISEDDDIELDLSAVWSNYAISVFFSGDLGATRATVSEAFKKALAYATNQTQKADIWYNISHIALGTGDVEWSLACLEISLSYDKSHPEALNNFSALGAQETESSAISTHWLRQMLQESIQAGKLFESYYNLSLVEFCLAGRREEAFKLIAEAKKLHPQHIPTNRLYQMLLDEINQF